LDPGSIVDHALLKQHLAFKKQLGEKDKSP